MAISHSARLWLAGTALSLFAVHSNWDLPLAAWLYPILLLRYSRLKPARDAIMGVGASVLIANLFWLAATGMLFVPIAVAAFVLLAVLLTVPFALDRLFAPRLSSVSATLIFPASRVAMEYLFRAVGFGDWGTLGVTQHGNLLLIQTAAVTGVYGVSFLIAWFASVANGAWEQKFQWPAIRRESLTYLGVFALVITAGAIRLLFFRPTSHTLRVAGIGVSRSAENASKDALKAAVAQYWKPDMVLVADPVQVKNAFSFVDDELIGRTELEARAGARVVLWPETQAKVLDGDLNDFLDRIKVIARNEKVYVGAAFALYSRGATADVRNVVVLITPEGTTGPVYDKTHPTPMEPMSPGKGLISVVATPFGRLSNVICYDADYPELMRQAATKGADLMLIPADDWKGFEDLHAENVVFRAVENGYSVLRESSHGVSTALDSQGRVLSSVNYFATDDPVFIAHIPLQPRTRTVYSVFGNVFAWLCAVATVLLVTNALWQFPRKKE